MLAFVVAGGEIDRPEVFAPIAQAADLVIAADSGYDYLLSMGIRPHLLLGDLDSISPEAKRDAVEHGVPLEQFPPEKDYTDTELTFHKAVERGASTIVACGMFGRRLDHTLANVLLLAAPDFRRLDLRMLDEQQEVRLVRQRLSFRSIPGEVVSLLPVGGDVCGVTTSGLYYPLSDATLRTGPALGVSNVSTAETVAVEVREGLLLLTRIFTGGLDGRAYLMQNPAT